MAALCLCLAGCGNAEPETAKTVEAPGTEATETAPERVVALTKSIGELWLLAGGNLVGVTDDAFGMEGLSPEAVSIGGLLYPSAEAVLALEPDLVLTRLEIPGHKALAEELTALGIPVRAVEVDSFADYAETMEAFAALTGRDDLYQKNVEEVRERIDALVSQVAGRIPDGTDYLCLKINVEKKHVLKKACPIFTKQ